jgi:hypothetical protein
MPKKFPFRPRGLGDRSLWLARQQTIFNHSVQDRVDVARPSVSIQNLLPCSLRRFCGGRQIINDLM